MDFLINVQHHFRTKTHGEAMFQHWGPRLWNSLPEDMWASSAVEVFKKKTKDLSFLVQLLSSSYMSSCFYLILFKLNLNHSKNATRKVKNTKSTIVGL